MESQSITLESSFFFDNFPTYANQWLQIILADLTSINFYSRFIGKELPSNNEFEYPSLYAKGNPNPPDNLLAFLRSDFQPDQNSLKDFWTNFVRLYHSLDPEKQDDLVYYIFPQFFSFFISNSLREAAVNTLIQGKTFFEQSLSIALISSILRSSHTLFKLMATLPQLINPQKIDESMDIFIQTLFNSPVFCQCELKLLEAYNSIYQLDNFITDVLFHLLQIVFEIPGVSLFSINLQECKDSMVRSFQKYIQNQKNQKDGCRIFSKPNQVIISSVASTISIENFYSETNSYFSSVISISAAKLLHTLFEAVDIEPLNSIPSSPKEDATYLPYSIKFQSTQKLEQYPTNTDPLIILQYEKLEEIARNDDIEISDLINSQKSNTDKEKFLEILRFQRDQQNKKKKFIRENGGVMRDIKSLQIMTEIRAKAIIKYVMSKKQVDSLKIDKYVEIRQHRDPIMKNLTVHSCEEIFNSMESDLIVQAILFSITCKKLNLKPVSLKKPPKFDPDFHIDLSSFYLVRLFKQKIDEILSTKNYLFGPFLFYVNELAEKLIEHVVEKHPYNGLTTAFDQMTPEEEMNYAANAFFFFENNTQLFIELCTNLVNTLSDKKLNEFFPAIFNLYNTLVHD